jgi:plasmid maintenance system antidote protein VapI
LLKFYGTELEEERAILMPVPTPEEQIRLLKAYDLNPLIQLELQHSYELCTTNSFVSARKNKE